MKISEQRERARDRLRAGSVAVRRESVDTYGDDLYGDDESDATGYLSRSERGVNPTSPQWLSDDEDDEFDDGVVDRRSASRFDVIPDRWRGIRWWPGNTAAKVLVVAAVVATAVGLFAVWWDSPSVQGVPPLPLVENLPTTGAAPQAVSQPPTASDVPQADFVVSVVGLVPSPGLIHLPPGSRVADAISAAGGALDGADTLTINLAQKLADGDQIVVGAADQSGGAPNSSASSAGGSTAAPAVSGNAGGSAGGLVNLNSATEAELDGLPGVGPVTASSIVSWRATNGKFTDVEQLGEVDGIGPARLAKLRSLVSV